MSVDNDSTDSDDRVAAPVAAIQDSVPFVLDGGPKRLTPTTRCSATR